jgi:uncharacterized membrane protein
MSFISQQKKILFLSLLLCPTLYSMQNDAQHIAEALATAANHCNSSGYAQAVDQVLNLARQHPEDLGGQLGMAIYLNVPAPDFAGHAAAISYNLAFNNRTYTALSTARALLTAWRHLPTRVPSQVQAIEDLGIFTLSLTLTALDFYKMAKHLYRRSWKKAAAALVSQRINDFPYIRELGMKDQRNRLFRGLNALRDIQLQQVRQEVHIQQNNVVVANTAPAA